MSEEKIDRVREKALHEARGIYASAIRNATAEEIIDVLADWIQPTLEQNTRPQPDAAELVESFVRRVRETYNCSVCRCHETCFKDSKCLRCHADEAIAALSAKQDGVEAKYYELLYQVEDKDPGMSRHESALELMRKGKSIENPPAKAVSGEGEG